MISNLKLNCLHLKHAKNFRTTFLRLKWSDHNYNTVQDNKTPLYFQLADINHNKHLASRIITNSAILLWLPIKWLIAKTDSETQHICETVLFLMGVFCDKSFNDFPELIIGFFSYSSINGWNIIKVIKKSIDSASIQAWMLLFITTTLVLHTEYQ